jgi:D-alanine--D-alanine ligase
MNKDLTIAVICGGPSLEKGISLNSARSVCDHLSADLKKRIFFVNQKCEFFEITRELLYSNTPSDFEFKLNKITKAIKPEELRKILETIDFCIPLIHGPFGEDGQLQKILEDAGTEFLGANSLNSELAFDKASAYEILKQAGYWTPDYLLLTKDSTALETAVDDFLKTQKHANFIVKPCRAGSSIDVYKVNSAINAAEKAKQIFDAKIYDRVILEPFLEGVEFTLIVWQNEAGKAVALLPTEIEVLRNQAELFDYRKKYLATGDTRYHTPPRFLSEDINKIQKQAEELFELFKLRDCVRLDGWLLENGQICFTDINCASGMEQNSFFFLQAAQIGFSHKASIAYILKSALKRRNIDYPELSTNESKKKELAVIFGGDTAERNVSLMSGTNVWLKLSESNRYAPKPFFLDQELNVWQLPYSYALYHTTEEISDLCRNSLKLDNELAPFRTAILNKLEADLTLLFKETQVAKKYSLDEFLTKEKQIFIAIHGGFGENGDLQEMCEKYGVTYTGSRPAPVRLCLDKYATGETVKALNHPEILTAKRMSIKTAELCKEIAENKNNYWNELATELAGTSGSVIVKPTGDGCSAGVARIASFADLKCYTESLINQVHLIPKNSLSLEQRHIEMPASLPEEIIFEEFIESDHLAVEGGELIWEHRTGIVEITVGVYGKEPAVIALNPSITIAAHNVLSLEEKFQGGTGINLTPPPTEYVSQTIIDKVRKNITTFARHIGINGISRIDAFLKIKTGTLIIIEVNSIPGLTPSTVTYHQALAEIPPLNPCQFLETIVDNSICPVTTHLG